MIRKTKNAGHIAVAGLALAWGFSAHVVQAVPKSDSRIKVSATADKPDGDGKQVVTITLQIDKGWHTYANLLPFAFPGVQTTVAINAKTKPEKVKIDYPKGIAVKDPKFGIYFTYEDKAVIKATVYRAKDDTSPLEVRVQLQACTNKTCLAPSTVKLKVK